MQFVLFTLPYHIKLLLVSLLDFLCSQFWFKGFVNEQNYLIWSETNSGETPQTPLHPQKACVVHCIGCDLKPDV